MNLTPVVINGVPVYKTLLLCPPQLITTLGYFGTDDFENNAIGFWYELNKTTVSDGYSTTTDYNLGWYSFSSHITISPYLSQINEHYRIYDECSPHIKVLYGFVIFKSALYLVDLKNMSKLLRKNYDCRPDWVRNVTINNILDSSWMLKYREWRLNFMPDYPMGDLRCKQSSKKMISWLNSKI